MTQIAMATKWKFVVEYVDQDTGEISGAIGQASTREECEEYIEHEVQCYSDHERSVINAEASEICVECEGDGQIPIGNGGCVICEACGGHLGSISKFTMRP